MLTVEAAIVNAFVDQGEGGNPAAVVLDADEIATGDKQRIAAHLGLSETAFVSSSTTADLKLEFFTPNKQIPHCGHATVASIAYLVDMGELKPGRRVKETIDGPRGLLIEDDMVFMSQRAPQSQPLADAEATAALEAVGVDNGELMTGQRPEIVNTGVSFLLAPLKNQAATRAATPDLSAIERLCEAWDLVGFYLFSTETSVAGRHAGARMFAPRYGIAEESATGMAAGPLACWLHQRLGYGDGVLYIEQGRLMEPPSPSLITVRLYREDGRIRSLMAGGRAAFVERRAVRL